LPESAQVLLEKWGVENLFLEMVEKICLALGCTADDVLDFIPDSPDNGTADNVE